MGVGDDCAVLDYSTDCNLRALVTTDVLLEGIHFDLTYTPLRPWATRRLWSTSAMCMP